jgi:hypothetical protein
LQDDGAVDGAVIKEEKRDSQCLFHPLERRFGLFKEADDDPFAKFTFGVVVHLEDLLERAGVKDVCIISEIRRTLLLLLLSRTCQQD